jgi:hypothetical protein
MRNSKIELLCLSMVGVQAIFFLLVQSSLVGNKVLPFGAFIIPAVLGFILGMFGLSVIVKELLNRQPIGFPLLFASGLCISSFLMYEVNLGWQNLDFRRGNDYSTDIMNVPKYKISREDRLNFGETKFWSLFEMSDKTLKADASSIIVPLPLPDIKRLVKKMARNSGWIMVRHEALGSSSTGLTETFEFKAGIPLIRQRSDVVVRVVSRQNYSAVIDIRSSSPNKRVDLGFNNMMINQIRAQLFEMTDDSSLSGNDAAHAANL